MGVKSADAIVIGAGIAGTASAWYLRRAGLSVALIDTHGPAWGASGRNPGFLWLQTKAAGLAMDFSLACRRFAETLAGELPDFGFRGGGGLIIYRDPEYESVARSFVGDRLAAGLNVELIDRKALLDICPAIGAEVSGAVWNPLDAYQDTGKLVRLLADGFVVSGGSLIAPARVQCIQTAGGKCQGVRLDDGSTIASRLVVVATGPWSNGLLAPLGLQVPYRRTRFEAAETEKAPFAFDPVVAGQALFRFYTPPGVDQAKLRRDPSELLKPELGFTEQIAASASGTFQFGCAYAADSDGELATVAGQAMACSTMSRNFPAFANLAITRQWAGIVAQTPDGLPVIDAVTGVDGLVINAGHFFGNLSGAFTGSIVAALVSGRAPAYPLDGFSLSRFRVAH